MKNILQQGGDVFKCICGSFCIELNLHVEMVRIIAQLIQLIESNHFRIFNIFADYFASLSGRTLFLKTRNQHKLIYPVVSYYFIEFRARTKFSSGVMRGSK